MKSPEPRTHIQKSGETAWCGLRVRFLTLSVDLASATCRNCQKQRQLELERLTEKIMKLSRGSR